MLFNLIYILYISFLKTKKKAISWTEKTRAYLNKNKIFFLLLLFCLT